MKVGAYGLDTMSIMRKQLQAARRSTMVQGKRESPEHQGAARVEGKGSTLSPGGVEGAAKERGDAFTQLLTRAVRTDAAAQNAVDNYVRGDAPLHETMIAVTKADISLRLLVNVRNKLLDAYRQVMRMS